MHYTILVDVQQFISSSDQYLARLYVLEYLKNGKFSNPHDVVDLINNLSDTEPPMKMEANKRFFKRMYHILYTYSGLKPGKLPRR